MDKTGRPTEGWMDLQALRYVVTLAEELHFGRAARAHYISPQPFGQRVQKLERELGLRLFDRTSRRVVVTPAGERFVERARLVLSELDGLRNDAAPRLRAADRVLRVGVLGFGAGDHWPALRAAVAAQHPELAMEFRDLDLVDQYDAVRRGEVDVAIVQFVGGLDGLEFDEILTTPRVAVVPAASVWSDAVWLTARDLDDVPWLEIGDVEPGLRSWAGSATGSGTVSVRHPAAIPAAVATTGRVCLHAAEAARYYPRPDVRFVPVEGEPVRIAVATRSDDVRPAVSSFRRAADAVRSVTAA